MMFKGLCAEYTDGFVVNVTYKKMSMITMLLLMMLIKNVSDCDAVNDNGYKMTLLV